MDYDPIDHLNLLFSHPSTVSSISQVSQTLRDHKNDVSSEITDLETNQAYGADSSLERMQSAQAELAQLFRKIETVRSRAIETEQNITSMTADIKRLDNTKRNLTLSMTALKRLQMLTTAYEQLRGLAKTRQYRECASLLQAVLQLMKHFNSYRGIDQIAALSRGVADLQRVLLEQVCEDFEMAFAKGEVAARKGMLVEACLVMDALGDTARSRITTWYINTQLREYRQLFRGNDEAGSLDNIGRRYGWFRRMLKMHEEEHAAIFPAHWKVNEMLAAAFCDGTREDYKGILERSMRRTDGPKLDVNLLLSCFQETLDFEHGLERRFANEVRASIDTLSSADDRTSNFHGSISAAFVPYLSLWIENQDKQLASMIPTYRNQTRLIPQDEEFSPTAVIPSAIELFHFYKRTLSQCARLSSGERLFDLAKVLAKYLDEYAQQVLLFFLQRSGAHGPPLQDIVMVLNTADFWSVNANQLEENIKKRIDAEFKDKIDLSSQADAFLGVASAAVLALVRIVERQCEAPWREMRNTNWATMESVGDHSSYVGELLKAINEKAEEVLATLVKPQYARAFCDNLVDHLATAYLSNIVQCKPISEVAAEQASFFFSFFFFLRSSLLSSMLPLLFTRSGAIRNGDLTAFQMLLDKYVMTKAFENLLSYHNKPSMTPQLQQQPQPPPAGYVRRVTQTMNRIDPLLKTLQVRPSPPEGLVQAYLIHIADRSDTNFRKILELKGVRKSDQSHLMELFTIHRDSNTYEGKLAQGSTLLTPLLNGQGLGSTGLGGSVAGVSSSAAGSTSAAGAMTGLQGKFEASSLGEKLLSAARDLGQAGGGSEKSNTGTAGVGQQAEKAMNENLKNFGKFFRRDLGGFGVRFGKRDSGEDGSR